MKDKKEMTRVRRTPKRFPYGNASPMPPSGTFLNLTVETLMEHLDLIVESDQYSQEDIWRALLSASAQATTVEDTTRKLEDAPCANTVRGHLKRGLLTRMELQDADDTLLDVLKRLLARLEGIGVGLRRLYLDRGFYSVEIIRFLKE